MVQIIKANPRKTFSEKLNAGLGSGLEMASKFMKEDEDRTKEAQEGKRISELIGQDVSSLSPELRKEAFKQDILGKRDIASNQQKFDFQKELQDQKYKFEQDLKKSDLTEKNKKEINKNYQEKVAPLEGGIDTLNRMRSLRTKGNLGRGSSIAGFFGGETARDRGEYSRLGKSLIQMSTSIPIRNRSEFETLAADLYDPSIQDDEAEGILDAMERIIQNSIIQNTSLEENEIEMGQPQKKNESKKTNRPPLTSFHR